MLRAFVVFSRYTDDMDGNDTVMIRTCKLVVDGMIINIDGDDEWMIPEWQRCNDVRHVDD